MLRQRFHQRPARNRRRDRRPDRHRDGTHSPVDCGVDPACIKDKTTAAEKRPTKARIITSLLYRHWTAWQEPTRTHIVYVPLNGGAARDLTPGAYDAPPFSLGGGDEFDVSPDSKELAYARNTSDHPEISTNSDIFIVPLSGGTAKRITTREGADTSPKYSPDGRWIAWRSQARAGYESDRFELWIYDRTSGATRRLAPNFDNWIDSATWSPDSKSIYVTAPEKSKEAIYEIGLGDGVPYVGPAAQRRRLLLLTVLAAVGRRGISRDKVLSFLWPDADGEQARQALYQALHVVRRAFGQEAIVGGTTAQLAWSARSVAPIDDGRHVLRHDDAGNRYEA